MGDQERSPESPRLARDLAMVALAVFSIGLILYDEIAHPTGTARDAVLFIDFAVVVVFLLEFLVRLWRADSKRAFLKRNWYEIPGLVPMIAGEASFLRFFRLARLVRVFRLFRLVAVVARLRRANRIADRFLAASHLLTVAVVTASVMIGCGFAVWMFERGTNPQFADFFDALWWAIVTGTTVGYGDMVPETIGGRIFAVILMFTGIGLIGVLAASIAAALARLRQAREGSADPVARPVEERLREVSDLHEKGRLTAEEFSEAKARILGEPS